MTVDAVVTQDRTRQDNELHGRRCKHLCVRLSI